MVELLMYVLWGLWAVRPWATSFLRSQGVIYCRQEAWIDLFAGALLPFLIVVLAVVFGEWAWIGGTLPWAAAGLVFSHKSWKRHRDHDEDCRRPRRRARAGSRIRIWWKPRVLVAPA